MIVVDVLSAISHQLSANARAADSRQPTADSNAVAPTVNPSITGRQGG